MYINKHFLILLFSDGFTDSNSVRAIHTERLTVFDMIASPVIGLLLLLALYFWVSQKNGNVPKPLSKIPEVIPNRKSRRAEKFKKKVGYAHPTNRTRTTSH